MSTPDKDKQPHSVIILWDDGDIREQGAFHWAGLAHDEDDAEVLARADMFAHHAEEQDWDEETILEESEKHLKDLTFGGSLVSWTGGVNIWAAHHLLEAAQKLLAEVKTTSAYEDAESGEDDALMAAVRATETAIRMATCREDARP